MLQLAPGILTTGNFRCWPDPDGRTGADIGPIGASGPAGGTGHRRCHWSGSETVVPCRPRRAGPISAARSGKFARTDFTKTGFAAAGPRLPRRSPLSRPQRLGDPAGFGTPGQGSQGVIQAPGAGVVRLPLLNVVGLTTSHHERVRPGLLRGGREYTPRCRVMANVSHPHPQMRTGPSSAERGAFFSWCADSKKNPPPKGKPRAGAAADEGRMAGSSQ
jgi:hypothetical protein